MLFENNTKKVLDRFFIRPTEEFHLRKLARETKLSTTAVKNAIDSLKKERLVNVEKTKIKTTMIANRSDKFIRLKKLFNLKSIYLSEFYEKLIKDYKKPECIILFGSYMRGEDIERSDIDITVITEKEKKDYREY
ncbi:MAG: nucleotidyltransferase domain-containing protein, partial [Candidatus Woesearchaeota archaeon]